jgi:O-antigen/teichoic acid export membrane protein
MELNNPVPADEAAPGSAESAESRLAAEARLNSATARLAFFGALYSTGSSYFLQAVALVVGVVLARLVAPAEFGVLALALTIYDIIQRIRLFGLGQIMMSKPAPEGSDWTTFFTLALGLSLAALGLTLATLPILARFYPVEVLQVLVVMACLAVFDPDGLAAVPDTWLRKGLQDRQIAQIDVAAGLLSMGAAVAAAVAGWGVWALVVRQGTEVFTRFVASWLMAGWRLGGRPTVERAKELMRAGAHLWLGGVSSLISFRYDDFLVGSMVGVSALGFYSRAFDYAKLPMGPLAGVYAVSLPTFARLQGNRRLMSRAYRVFLDSIALFALPASIWLVIVAPEFVDGLIGPQWRPIIPLVRLLLPFAILRPVLDGTAGIPVVTGRPDIRSKQAVLETVVMLVAASLLIPRYAAVGAAISAGAVVLAALLGVYFWYVKDALDIPWRRTFVAPVLASLAAAGLSAWCGTWATDWPALARLALKTGAFGLGFGVLILLFHRSALLETYATLAQAWRTRQES